MLDGFVVVFQGKCGFGCFWNLVDGHRRGREEISGVRDEDLVDAQARRKHDVTERKNLIEHSMKRTPSV